MSKRLREKIALVVFVALVAFAGCCLGGYLLAGHSWNVAASSIDDTFGSMDGYVVIVYDGTVSPQAESAASNSAAASGEAGASGSLLVSNSDSDSGLGSASESALAVDASLDASASSSEAEDGADGLLEGESGAAAATADDAATADGADAASGKTDAAAMGGESVDGDAAESDAASGSSRSSNEDSLLEDAQEASPSASSSSSSVASSSKDAVTAAEVRASYEDKNAEVLVLDSANIGKYRDGTILKKGGYRFGVFSVDEDTTPAQIKQQVKYFEEHQVDFVVAMASDRELLEDADSGIDIVISTQDEGLAAVGEAKGGIFFVDAPEIGSVGAILISPNNVVSAKVVKEL